MADNNTNGIEKGASGDAPAPELQPSNPPAVTGPANAGEESVEPSIATKTAVDGAATADRSEAGAQNDAPATESKEELTETIDTAEKLAEQPEQPEKPADSAPAQSTTTEITAADAPSVTNGETKEPPKPVTVEEVRDQDLPAVPPSQPVEMTGALPVKEPAKDAPKTAPTPLTPEPEPEKTEISTGEKRKPSETEASNGDLPAEKPSEDAPAEKKQKTNGATTNGTPRKAGRPRKDKKAPPSVGRTARKTRSQGAAD
ncbi:hypothetical protein F4776DRAFT_13422 [Hypoxylon sp. NC0597]|nr:hypothetical protein F4776DRAFT_13422 [Hypoxylon sp. NC0597]